VQREAAQEILPGRVTGIWGYQGQQPGARGPRDDGSIRRHVVETMCMAQMVDVFATGIVAGAFTIGTFAMHPAAARLDPAHHIIFRQELIRRLSRFLPPFMLTPLVVVPLAMTLCRSSIAVSVAAASLVLSLTTVGITVMINAPLNRQFAKWTPEALPSDWPEDIRRWDRAHTLRMTTAAGAFASAIVAGW